MLHAQQRGASARARAQRRAARRGAERARARSQVCPVAGNAQRVQRWREASAGV